MESCTLQREAQEGETRYVCVFVCAFMRNKVCSCIYACVHVRDGDVQKNKGTAERCRKRDQSKHQMRDKNKLTGFVQ